MPIPPGKSICYVSCPMSDRALKYGARPVTSAEVLERLSRLPISSWTYNNEPPGVRHIGPMAQDFNAAFGVGADPRWDLVGAGFWIPAFYAWGSDLAMVPEGERQFYTALCAQNLYILELADDADVVWTREIAIGGYQSMLDHFPEARSYDESGTFSWPLAPLAIQGIQDLGGTVEGGWVLVESADGELVAVQP